MAEELGFTQTSSGAHPVYLMGARGSFPKGNVAGQDTDHSPPSAEVKNMWSYISTPRYIFMTWCLINYAQE
jgi:hypothetical protein